MFLLDYNQRHHEVPVCPRGSGVFTTTLETLLFLTANYTYSQTINSMRAGCALFLFAFFISLCRVFRFHISTEAMLAEQPSPWTRCNFSITGSSIALCLCPPSRNYHMLTHSSGTTLCSSGRTGSLFIAWVPSFTHTPTKDLPCTIRH